jgi:hypothetical protein
MAKKNGKYKATAEDLARIDKMAGQYVAIRERRRELKAQFDQLDGPFEEAMHDLGLRMMNFLDKTGQESARTSEGTVTTTMRTTAALSDPEEFVAFVRKHDMLELMDRRANPTACRAFAEENGKLPPGVRLNSIRTISVRSPT